MNPMKKIIFLILCTPLFGFALTESEIEQRLSDALRQIHPNQNAAWYKALGENAPPVIIRMYKNSKNTYHRIRLIEAASAFTENQQITEFLRSELKNNSQTAERRSLATSLYRQSGENSFTELEALLLDKDPQMRKRVAEVFRDSKSEKFQNRYEQYRKNETESWILDSLDKKKPEFKPLQIVANNESPHPWLGNFNGYFQKIENKVLKSFPAKLNLTTEPQKEGKTPKFFLSLSTSIDKKNLNYLGDVTDISSQNLKGIIKNKSHDLNFEIKPLSKLQSIVIILETPEFVFIGNKTQ